MTGPADSLTAVEGVGPWHPGERAAQARAGTAERMAVIGPKVIRSFMPEQHRAFFAQLPWVFVGAVDAEGWPVAAMLAGVPGFVASPDPRHLRIDALPAADDPLAKALHPEAPLGLIGVELPTRRRNRANGRVIARDGRGFDMLVEESFGNCPQYIQRRAYLDIGPAAPAPVETLDRLDDEARQTLAAADTCFVVTAAARAAGVGVGVDISHRGGRPGFLRLGGDGVVTVPDYAGNGFFNTLGNLVANPRAALLVVDFPRGDLLQIVGTTEIVWDGPSVGSIPGAQRLWKLTPRRVLRQRGAVPLQFSAPEFSPVLPAA
jgi:predicted pyridoxine 5'-phosphate oxidase superfamily flavin-nucleotide-binding protein